jgi:hypothetical protein
MSLRVLLIGPPELEAIARVVAYASRPEHLYRPFEPAPVTPGDDPGYVLHLGDFRIVYSHTRSKDKTVFRHLSVSVPNPEKLPAPAAVEVIMQHFGFVGGLANSDVLAHPVEHCIIVAQPVEQTTREQAN